MINTMKDTEPYKLLYAKYYVGYVVRDVHIMF